MGRSTHNIVGKVSIGTPVKEPMPVGEDLIGMKAARAHEELRIRKGKSLQEADIRRMKKKGIEEFYVIRGRSPDQLRHFRLLRRSEEYEGEFVEDDTLMNKYDLGKKPKSIPIVFPVNRKDRIFKDGMRNWDAKNSKMFCSSDDGETARRANVENGEYTGEYKEIECIPFYRDERGPICPFRDYNSKLNDKLPCKYRARLFFNILTEEPSSFDLGSFFKFETSSHNTGQQINRTLDDIADQFGKLSFIPCELELKYDKRVTPEGHKTEQPSVGLSVSFDLLEKYADTIDRVKDMISTYRPDVEIQDNTSEEAIDNEFRPEVQTRQMEKEGLIEEDPDKSEEIVEDVNPLHLAEDATFDEKLNHMEALALQLPQNLYESFKSKSGKLSPDNIDDQIQKCKSYLEENLTEEERRQNADEKAEKVK